LLTITLLLFLLLQKGTDTVKANTMQEQGVDQAEDALLKKAKGKRKGGCTKQVQARARVAGAVAVLQCYSTGGAEGQASRQEDSKGTGGRRNAGEV